MAVVNAPEAHGIRRRLDFEFSLCLVPTPSRPRRSQRADMEPERKKTKFSDDSPMYPDFRGESSASEFVVARNRMDWDETEPLRRFQLWREEHAPLEWFFGNPAEQRAAA